MASRKSDFRRRKKNIFLHPDYEDMNRNELLQKISALELVSSTFC